MNSENLRFPVTMPATWRLPTCFTLNEHLKDWLLNPASLTQRLKQHCHRFSVELLGQEVDICSAQEANEHIKEGQDVIVREGGEDANHILNLRISVSTFRKLSEVAQVVDKFNTIILNNRIKRNFICKVRLCF